MSKKVETLIPLQAVDADIHKLRRLMNVKPAELAKLAGDVEAAKKAVEHVKNEVKEIKVEQSKFDLEIKGKDDQIKKLQTQALSAKKNEEYLAIQKQISGIEADKKVIEERWLEVDFKIEDAHKRMKNREDELKALDKRHAEEKQRIDKEMSVLKGQVEQLEAKRKQVLVGIDPELLSSYQRILVSKSDDGLALARVARHAVVEKIERKKKRRPGDPTPEPEAPVEGERVLQWSYSCEGCQCGITTQDVNVLLLGREVLMCRNCSRILYLIEQPAVSNTPTS